MEITQLRYFKKTAELQHITRAAEELMVAQPALSRTIKALEVELGVNLFDRHGKTITLNESGKVLLRYANAILALLDDVKLELSDLQRQNDVTLKVAMNAATSLLPSIVLGFKRSYPNIRIVITQDDEDGLEKGDCDICVNASACPPAGDNTRLLLEEECVVGLPQDHRLAGRESLDVAELSGEKFLILQHRKPLAEITRRCCLNAGFEPEITLECESRSTVFSFIEVGMGIAFIPSVTWDFTGREALRLVKVEDPACKRYIYISWRRGAYISNAMKAFLDHTTDFFRELQTRQR